MGLRGHTAYGVYLLWGVIFAVPACLRILWAIITRPRAFFHRSNWSAMELPPLLEGLHHRMVDVAPGVALHCVSTSTDEHKDKPFMLLVHGFPEYWGSWRRQMEAFRSTYDVTAIDMRGYGMSSKPDSIQAYAIGNLAADIAAVIKTLGNGRKAILIAHDWGGAVCWTVGHKYPELLSHLIIACAPHPLCTKANMDLNQFLRSYYIFLFQLPFIPEIAITGGDYALVDEAFLNGPMAVRRRGAMTAEDAKRYKKELARPGAVTATVNYYRALGRRMAYGGDKTSDGSLRKPISVPTLLIWAENDGALGPQLMRGTEKYVSNLRVRVLGNCSHWAQQDCPEEFNKMVMDFLARD